MINEQVFLWSGFTLFILGMLALDLGVFQRKPHVIEMKEAFGWFGFWMGLALIFNLGIVIFHDRGTEAGLEFLTGFLVEKSLSIDNIFVFILIFRYFHVPPVYQHKVLFWGIIGAIILRGIFIMGGMAILDRFHWSIYVFGGVLFLTGISMLLKKNESYHPEKNWLIRFFQRFFPVNPSYEGHHFFIRKNHRLFVTPLFIVLLAIESSDILFALDSIPAIFSITSDPFIVYTSNIFALLGLRALYFAVSGFMNTFYFLHYGFSSIIIILAIKMLLSDVYEIPVAFLLALIIVILLICVIISLLRPRQADLKIVFERLERLGLISFRRLLMFENIIDLRNLKVKDAMQPREKVAAIQLNLPWEKNQELISRTRFSRYPVIKSKEGNQIGVIHVKNLLFLKSEEMNAKRIKSLTHPCVEIDENALLEEALGLFQRNSEHLAIVINSAGQWAGILCIEDVLEEIVGRIDDEFDLDRAGKFVSLAEALSPDYIVFDLEARSIPEAVKEMIEHISPNDLPINRQAVIQTILKRDATVPTYLGNGVAVPRGRIKGLNKPVLAFARSGEGIPIEGTIERAELIFLLLTPYGTARMQPHLLADIIDLKESEYVMERLHKTNSPQEVIEAIRAGQQVAID